MTIDVNLFECPTWDSSNIIKGEFISKLNHVDINLMNAADYLIVQEKRYVIFRKIYNHDSGDFEIWVKGKK